MPEVDMTPCDHRDSLPRMPAWVTAARAETLEDVAFLSGAALAHLHLVVGRDDVPQALWRDRLALHAAAAYVAVSGRPERAGELRDILNLLRPGDLPGPAGEICLCWRRAAGRPVSVGALHRALPQLSPEQIAAWLDCRLRAGRRDAGQGAPVTRAAMVLETVLTEAPRAETSALILADAALARALGHDHLVPLLATGLQRGHLRRSGAELRLAVHRAVTLSALEAAGLAADLARRAARLAAVTPKLRARRAGEAVGIFLARDAVAPAALTRLMSDRAARRFCDRLVALGALRELTGRDTFRLYGV